MVSSRLMGGKALACSVALALCAGAAQATSVTPSESARLLARVALEDLIATYLYRLDHGGTATLGELVTDDAMFEINGQMLAGRKAIQDYYAARPTSRLTRHVSTNLYIVFDDEDHAHSVYTLTYYKVESGEKPTFVPSAIGDYSERLTRGPDGKWRFAYRKAKAAFGAAQ